MDLKKFSDEEVISLYPKILKELDPKHYPLMFSMLRTICDNKKLEINW